MLLLSDSTEKVEAKSLPKASLEPLAKEEETKEIVQDSQQEAVAEPKEPVEEKKVIKTPPTRLKPIAKKEDDDINYKPGDTIDLF